jgi:PadR family transcriptional regulator, regulatory protein PadR
MGNKARGNVARDVNLALVRVHVLHHAAEEPIFGLEMMEELRRHGYEMGPGTLYPLLHALEEGGTLASTQEIVGGKVRRYYRITKAGRALLFALRARLRELVGEVLPGEAPVGLRGK